MVAGINVMRRLPSLVDSTCREWITLLESCVGVDVDVDVGTGVVVAALAVAAVVAVVVVPIISAVFVTAVCDDVRVTAVVVALAVGWAGDALGVLVETMGVLAIEPVATRSDRVVTGLMVIAGAVAGMELVTLVGWRVCEMNR